MKVCKICKKYFEGHGLAKRCSSHCMKLNRRANRTNREKCRRLSDPLFKAMQSLRSRNSHFLDSKQWQKSSPIKEITGCSPEYLQKHLDLTFIKNYGRPYNKEDKLHIDHITPLNAATTVEEMEKLNHYSNLQYLLSSDNIEKSNNLTIKESYVGH